MKMLSLSRAAAVRRTLAALLLLFAVWPATAPPPAVAHPAPLGMLVDEGLLSWGFTAGNDGKPARLHVEWNLRPDFL